MPPHLAPMRHWLPPAALSLAIVGSIPAFLLLPRIPNEALSLAVALVPMVAIPIGLRRHRIPDRRPWLIGMGGLAFVNIGNAQTLYRAAIGKDEAYLSENLVLAAGYLTLLSASVLVALRHVRGNDAGLVHAALIGVGVAGPLWEFLLRPRLISQGAATADQVFGLLDGLLLLTAAGPLLRASRTAPRARVALTYMSLSLLFPLIGTVLLILFPEHGAVWPSPAWAAGSLCLSAAALHPSAAHITEPERLPTLNRSQIKLRYIGAILAVNPVVGAMPVLWGGQSDTLLLSIGTLMMIFLVLTRFGQLLREREEAEAALTYQATHDEVTGLANRRDVLVRLDEVLDRWAAGALPDVAVLYCDLDGFKPVNDNLGHQAGDEVLRTVADRLRKTVSSGDTVGRLGGDEFLVVCPGLGPLGAATLQRRIQEAVSAPIRAGSASDIRVGVTVGSALAAPGERASSDGLIASADREMYAGKQLRRNLQPRAS